MRWKLTAAALAGLVLVSAAPASAGTLTTRNSCKWSFDNAWRHLDIDLNGVGSPAPVAPGSGLRLTQTTIRTRLPDYLAQAGHGFGVLKAGDNEIRAKVWVALAAPGTPQGIQVFPLETVAHTTITEDAGGFYLSSTPIDVTVPLPDSVWTAGSAPVGFRQAAAGTLPAVPASAGGANVTPLGSVFISATIGNGSAGTLNIDCQPGTGEGQNPPTVAAAGAFETVATDAGAPPTPAPALKKPVLSLRTTKLKLSGKRVSVALACADATCKGALTLKYAGGSAARKTTYTLAPGTRKTLKLTLSSQALRAVKRKSLLLSVRITADGGKTVTKQLRLKA